MTGPYGSTNQDYTDLYPDEKPGQRFHLVEFHEEYYGTASVRIVETAPTIGAGTLAPSFSYSAPGFDLEVQPPRLDRPKLGPPNEGWWASARWRMVGASIIVPVGTTEPVVVVSEWRGQDGEGPGVPYNGYADVSLASYDDGQPGFHGSPADVGEWLSSCPLIPSTIALAMTRVISGYKGPSVWHATDNRWASR